MQVKTIQIKAHNYKVHDKVLVKVEGWLGIFNVSVTAYLCTDEKDNVCLIYPNQIELINP